MALSNAEKQRRRRLRPELLRDVEAKFRSVRETKLVSMNLEHDALDGMAEIASYFGLSDRSRSALLNSMVKARLREAKDVMRLCDQMVAKRQPDTCEKLKALALEVFLLGGGRKELAQAHSQIFAQIASLATASDDGSVESSQIDFNGLEVLKVLKREGEQ
jgi:hypothetical protein